MKREVSLPVSIVSRRLLGPAAVKTPAGFFIAFQRSCFIISVMILFGAPGRMAMNNDTLSVNRNPDSSFARIPVLCYHNIQVQPKREDLLRISAANFELQMRMLRDSGYHIIQPAQLYDYIHAGRPLPAKPIMVTFDDSHVEHFTIAKQILNKYGLKGTFFIMTVCIGKKNYLSAGQIKALADAGNTIGCHTYDHPPVSSIHGEAWQNQLDKPVKRLEAITGRKVDYFAYPYGSWSEEAISELKSRGVKLAFQLGGHPSKLNPEYTLPRILVSGAWTAAELAKKLRVFDMKR